MSKTKTPAAKKKPQRAGKPPAKVAAAKAIEPDAPKVAPGTSPAARVVAKLAAKHARLTTAERGAFDLLATDEDRSVLGKKTKATAVRDEAVRVAVHVDEQLTTVPKVAELYAPERYVYFLEAILALDAQISLDAQGGGARGKARAAAGTERSAAVETRARLVRRLGRYAGRRKAEKDGLAAATGTIDTPKNLQDSLVALADLGASWLARADEASRFLARQASLTESVVAAARAAAESLGATTADASLGGSGTGKDSALTNRREGAVTLEIEHAVDVFDEAHDEDDIVGRIRIANESVRNVIEGHRRAAAAPAPAPAPAPVPAPVTPPAAPGADATKDPAGLR